MKLLNVTTRKTLLKKQKETSKKLLAGIGLSIFFYTGLMGQVSYNANPLGITGSDNTSYGPNVLTAISTGNFNFGFGKWALVNTTTGSQNAAFGGSVLGYNTSGSRNTGLGYAAGGNNTTGNDNTLVGNYAGVNITTGAENTAVGSQAFYSNAANSGYVAIGFQALYNSNSNIGAWPNHAVGYKALYSTTSGLQNSAFGYKCLYANTTAHNNSGFGLFTLQSNTTGGDNSAFGCVALDDNSTGSNNTAFGTLALDGNTTGSDNTGIGRGATVGAGNLTNATSLGSGAIVNASNKVRVGNTSVTVCEAPVAWTSDGRFKYNISESDVIGLEFIKKLRPVVYNFDAKKFEEFLTKNMPEETRKQRLEKDFSELTAIRQTGFIAQEVEKAAADAGYSFSGVNKPKDENDNYSLGYAHFVVPLVKAVQEQQKMIEDQKKEIESLKQQVSVSAGIQQSIANEGFSMDQNQPNPFTHETVVNYVLPKQIKNAYMGVYDLSGKQITTLPLNTSGQSITINSEKLAAGIYIYTIVADGRAMDSKRMIVAEK